jgi:transcriptional regulator with XRE-family HTH domain
MSDMAHENTERFARNLRKLCEGYGRRKQIADAVGVDPAHISKIASGRTIPGLDLSWRIALAVGMTVDELSTQEIEVENIV